MCQGDLCTNSSERVAHEQVWQFPLALLHYDVMTSLQHFLTCLLFDHFLDYRLSSIWTRGFYFDPTIFLLLNIWVNQIRVLRVVESYLKLHHIIWQARLLLFQNLVKPALHEQATGLQNTSLFFSFLLNINLTACSTYFSFSLLDLRLFSHATSSQ